MNIEIYEAIETLRDKGWQVSENIRHKNIYTCRSSTSEVYQIPDKDMELFSKCNIPLLNQVNRYIKNNYLRFSNPNNMKIIPAEAVFEISRIEKEVLDAFFAENPDKSLDEYNEAKELWSWSLR